MHILVDHNNVAVYMFNDELVSQVNIVADKVTFEGNQVEDTTLNSSNCQLVDIKDTAPADWIGRTLPVTIERSSAHSVWGQHQSGAGA